MSRAELDDYEAAATAESAAHPTAADRAITWAARLLLVVILAWIFCTDDAALTWAHVLVGLAGIPLAILATPLKEQP